MARSSSGGAAAAGGDRLEVQLCALLAVHVVTRVPLPAGVGLPWPYASERLTRVGMQTGYRVDDVAALTHDSGFIVVQSKKNLQLGAAEESPLAEALDQAVRQFVAGPQATPTERPWDLNSDRIIIATDVGAPKTVRIHLANVVRRLATLPPGDGVDMAAANADELKTLMVFEGHIRRLWRKHNGVDISPDEFRRFCSVVRVAAFDLQPGGADLHNAYTRLQTVVADRSRIGSAWKSIVYICKDLSADRGFATESNLRALLATDRIELLPPVSGPEGPGRVFVPEVVLHGPLTSGLLADRVARAEEALVSEPTLAVELYQSIMAELDEGGFRHQAATLQSNLSRALRKAGQPAKAERVAIHTAWEGIRCGEAPSKIADQLTFMQGIEWLEQTPSLTAEAVEAVFRYEAGDVSLSSVAQRVAAVSDDDLLAGDLLLWLAEACAVAKLPDLFTGLCSRSLAHADRGTDPEFIGRMRIAVAECRSDWSSVLATMEADCGPVMYVLALARQGQALVHENDLARAVDCYEQAVAGGTQHTMFAEVRTWLYDLRNLRFALGGRGFGYETHYTAQSLPRIHKLNVFDGKEVLEARAQQALVVEEHGRAHRTFMRLRHRMYTGAALAAVRQCESGLGMALWRQDPGAAIGHFLRGVRTKEAVKLQREQPDEPLQFGPEWLDGPPWQMQSVYEFIGSHGDLIPEPRARELFAQLSQRLVTEGRLANWASLAANETLMKALAAVSWASVLQDADQLLARLAPIAVEGGMRPSVEAHVDLLLGCARVHADLTHEAARQCADLMCANERAVPDDIARALEILAPAAADLLDRLLPEATSQRPWLFDVLDELDSRPDAFVAYATARMEAAAKPRTYTPGVTGFGSGLVRVARFSHLVEPELRDRFVSAMLRIAQEPRETNRERREAIDAIATVAHRASVTKGIWTDVRAAARPMAIGVGLSADDDPFSRSLGSPVTLALAANRLLVIIADDEVERASVVRTLLLFLMDGDIQDPLLLQNALLQAPPITFRNDLLALAISQSPAIRAFAAHCWARVPQSDPGIGRRLARDPAGIVRLVLAHGLAETGRTGTEDIRTLLLDDCRFTVRAAAQAGA